MMQWLNLIAWSHRRRYRFAARLVQQKGGRTLLDLGCGEGALLQAMSPGWERLVGVDRDEIALRKIPRQDRISTLTPQQFHQRLPHEQFDVVVCMEVLEHTTEEDRAALIEEIARRTSPEGWALVSVPIETGLSLWVKQFFRSFRNVATRHQHREWVESYTWGEWLRAGLGLEIDRPKHNAGTEKSPYWFHGHKGFRWKSLEEELRSHGLKVVQRRFSPLPFTGSWLNSQVWMWCRRESDAARSLSA